MPHQICNKISRNINGQALNSYLTEKKNRCDIKGNTDGNAVFEKIHALAVPCGSAMYLTFSRALLLRQLHNNTELLNSSLRGTSSQTKNYPSCADLD